MKKLKSKHRNALAMFVVVIITLTFFTQRGLKIIISDINNNSAPSSVNHQVADPAHNSRNSLDWGGTYKGTVWKGSKGEFKKILILSYERMYWLKYPDQSKKNYNYVKQDTFLWNDQGNMITLRNTEPVLIFFVAENYLIQLDSSYAIIKGKLEDKFILKKID